MLEREKVIEREMERVSERESERERERERENLIRHHYLFQTLLFIVDISCMLGLPMHICWCHLL